MHTLPQHATYLHHQGALNGVTQWAAGQEKAPIATSTTCIASMGIIYECTCTITLPHLMTLHLTKPYHTTLLKQSREALHARMHERWVSESRQHGMPSFAVLPLPGQVCTSQGRKVRGWIVSPNFKGRLLPYRRLHTLVASTTSPTTALSLSP